MGCSRQQQNGPFNMDLIIKLFAAVVRKCLKNTELIRWQPISANGSIKPKAKLSLSLSQQTGKGKHLKRGHNSNSIQSRASFGRITYSFQTQFSKHRHNRKLSVLNSTELNDKTNCQRPTNSNFVLSAAV